MEIDFYIFLLLCIIIIIIIIRKSQLIFELICVQQLPKVWLFPFMYAFSMFAVCITIAVLYRLHKRFFGRSLDIVLSEKSNAFGQNPGSK